MKNLPLLRWMEDIDPVLIERSDRYAPARHGHALRTVLVVAAVAVLLVAMLAASSLMMLDSYAQQNYPDYDGTVLHALDFVLTQDDNAFANALGEQNRASLHTLFNALRGVRGETETETEPESESQVYSEGLIFTQYSDGKYYVSDLGDCKDAHVRIPPTTPEGKTVSGIASRAFENEIGITAVTVPSTVTTIESQAFAGCSKLETVELSEGLTLIEAEAFRGCWRLTSLHLPASVIGVGQNVIGMCIMLKELTVDEQNPVYRSEGNCLIETESGALIAGCESSEIPEGISRIAPYAFFCMSGLRRATIPEGVTSIGDKAFLGCGGLRQVTFPSTLTRIGEQAFSECAALRHVILPEGLPAIESRAFEKSGLTGADLPSTLQSIGEGAFAECTSLSEIDLPEGLTVIEENLFYGCKKLARVGIPDSVKSIMPYAFYQCEGLVDPDLPPQLNLIGRSAFFQCSSLTSVTLPEGLSELGSYAFSSCHALKEVTIPAGLSRIPDNAFSCCIVLESIVIPEGVVSIGVDAFEMCSAMKSAHIPSSVLEIEERVFLTCKELSALTVSGENPRYKSEGNCLIDTWTDTVLFGNSHSEIPSGVRVIGAYALSNCDLRRVTLPDGVECIEPYAFYTSWETVSVVIPDSVTLIADSAFASCFNISNVYYTGTEAQWEQITIEMNNENLLDATVHFAYVP